MNDRLKLSRAILAATIVSAMLSLLAGRAAELAPFTPAKDLRGIWSFAVATNLPKVLILGDSIYIATHCRCAR